MIHGFMLTKYEILFAAPPTLSVCFGDRKLIQKAVGALCVISIHGHLQLVHCQALGPKKPRGTQRNPQYIFEGCYTGSNKNIRKQKLPQLSMKDVASEALLVTNPAKRLLLLAMACQGL